MGFDSITYNRVIIGKFTIGKKWHKRCYVSLLLDYFLIDFCKR